MNMGRRGLLKLMGMAPAVAAMAPAIAAQSSGMGVVGLGAALGAGETCAPSYGVQAAIGGPLKLFSFAEWLKTSMTDLRQQAKRVTTLDADIACMHLPLQTKVRMQQERQYQEILDNRKSWFEKTLERHGHVEVWQ